jgi:hypothetical protein
MRGALFTLIGLIGIASAGKLYSYQGTSSYVLQQEAEQVPAQSSEDDTVEPWAEITFNTQTDSVVNG